MSVIRNEIRFLLNDEPIVLHEISPEQTILDFLRLDRRLRGTKEGCAEGDCGACSVLIGRLGADGLIYESATSCIRFLGSLDGCHVVTIEHLAGRDGRLHPVQQAMVDFHGSQCGFCTPGIVIALYGLWMQIPNPTDGQIEKALQGNLCRCTGYEPIIKAARAISSYGSPSEDILLRERDSVIAQLEAMRDGRRVEVGAEGRKLILPADLDDLAQVVEQDPSARIIAGSTDVGLWVTKHMRDLGNVVFISHLDELRQIGEQDGALLIGAGVSYSQAYQLLRQRIPEIADLINRIGGEQVRNMGTIGGNIANGSPIGDTPPPLIALGASVTLRKGKTRRTLALEDFFIAYGKQDRHPGEFVESIRVPLPRQGAHFAVHKISKRHDEDITAALAAFHVMLDDAGNVSAARIVYGGMAATPKRASHVENALLGKAWCEATIEQALPAYGEDFAPISDMRASSTYRMMVAQNLLRRFYLETGGADESVHLSRGRAI